MYNSMNPVNVTTNPHVMQRENGSMYSYDLLSKLLKDRVIMVVGEINDDMAQLIVAQLHYLHSEDPTAPITMYINSPGGSVTAGMSIIDTMEFIGNPIITICMGMAASMGSLIFMLGTKGLRFIMPRATVMIHQPLGGAQGQATEIEITAKHILKTKAIINQMIADATGNDIEVVTADTERDNYKDANESVAYGIADHIIKTFDESKQFVEDWMTSHK